MQNEFVWVVSSRPTLGKIETTLQIGYAQGLEKFAKRQYQIISPSTKNGYVTRKTMRIEAGAQAVRYTTSRDYFESLTTGVVLRTPQITSKVVYLSAVFLPAYAHGVGHVAFFCT